MKRAVLTDSRTKAISLFENPQWRLGSITPKKDGIFDVRMIHENGEELTINVNSEKRSLTKRFEGW
jgi:hypothetical protein